MYVVVCVCIIRMAGYLYIKLLVSSKRDRKKPEKITSRFLLRGANKIREENRVIFGCGAQQDERRRRCVAVDKCKE